MKKLLLSGVLAASMAPLALAQSPFDGTWKVDLSKAQMPKKPDVYVLMNGMYECKTCAPPYKVKADGSDQAVSGHPYFDTIAIVVVDDHTVKETDKKNGKVVGTGTTTVAPDGKTATFEFSDSSNTNADPVTGKGVTERVEPGPPGSHAVSGGWRVKSFDNMSDNGLMFTYKVDGDTLNMSAPTGQSYSAKMNGTEAPFKGDPGTTSVQIKKLSPNSFEETDKRDGKVISVSKATVSPDGKTMHFDINDTLHGTTMSFVAAKQ